MRPVHALVLTALCGASFGLGLFAARSPASPVARFDGPLAEHSPWREDLSALRGTAEGDSLRAIALRGIDDAPGRYALHESVTLLGWVGDERDVDLLVALLHDEDVDDAVIAALGRIGAVDELLELTEHPEHRIGVLVGLGLTSSEAALPHLVDSLQDPVLRDGAAHALALHGSEAAQQALIDCFPDADGWLVSSVAHALASFPSDSPARALLREQLTHGDSSHRNAAMNALTGADDPGIFAALMEAVSEGSPTQRAAAINALGTLDDPRAIPALVRVAESGRRAELWPAVWALSTLTDPAAEEALRGLVRSGNEEVASSAAGALTPEQHEESVDTLFWALEHRGSRTRQAARERLFNAAWKDCPPQVMELALSELVEPTNGSWSGNAWSLVLRHGDRDDHALVEELLVNGDGPNRAEALWALQGQPGLLPDRIAASLLDDEDPNVRRAALALLEARGDGGEVDLEAELIKRLGRGDRRGWDGLEDTLARIGGPDAIDALLRQVADGTTTESGAALSALVNAGDPAHLDRLRQLYERTDDEGLRSQLLQGVLWSGTPGAEDFAYLALDEEDPFVRSNAASALGTAGTPKALKALDGLLEDEDPQVRAAALGALADQPGMRPRLIAALEDPDLAPTALSSLQSDRSVEAREAVEAIALDPDADVGLRTTAIYGMGWNSGDPSVLGEALHDEDPVIQQAALSALESRGTTESAEHIATLLDSDDDAIASQAAYTLQRMGGRIYDENRELVDELAGDTGMTGAMLGDWGGPVFLDGFEGPVFPPGYEGSWDEGVDEHEDSFEDEPLEGDELEDEDYGDTGSW